MVRTTQAGGGTGPAGTALLEWWAEHGRDLPWRATRDPWEVLVCEVMAQQTQVARVAERWRPFLDRFPTPAACAAAPPAEVLRAWAGLGYNRRALALHRCATAVVERHGGRLPRAVPELLDLPGIGPYTARAIAAFAFEDDHGVVDTNTARVLARWEGRPLGRREVQEAADAAVPPGEGWAWNQAMLDLGATVCTRRAPDCGACPTVHVCRWGRAGRPQPDPADASYGVSRGQSRFAGSDRQGRGRLVAALRHGPVPVTDAATVMGWAEEPERAARVVDGLVTEGLVARRGAVLELPEEPVSR